MVYSHIDRIITGGAVPVEPIELTAGDESVQSISYRREMGVINIEVMYHKPMVLIMNLNTRMESMLYGRKENYFQEP